MARGQFALGSSYTKNPASIGADTQTSGVRAEVPSSNSTLSVVAPWISVSPSKITGGARISPDAETGPGIASPSETGSIGHDRSHSAYKSRRSASARPT